LLEIIIFFRPKIVFCEKTCTDRNANKCQFIPLVSGETDQHASSKQDSDVKGVTSIGQFQENAAEKDHRRLGRR